MHKSAIVQVQQCLRTVFCLSITQFKSRWIRSSTDLCHVALSRHLRCAPLLLYCQHCSSKQSTRDNGHAWSYNNFHFLPLCFTEAEHNTPFACKTDCHNTCTTTLRHFCHHNSIKLAITCYIQHVPQQLYILIASFDSLLFEAVRKERHHQLNAQLTFTLEPQRACRRWIFYLLFACFRHIFALVM